MSNFETMTIGQLREAAKHMRVAVERTATKTDIIEALNAKQRNRTLASPADKTSDIAPGYVRIRIDESQNSNKQIPVYLFDNGLEYTIPRGVEVDVPARIVRHLQNATVKRHNQIEGEDGKPKTTIIQVLQYPFRVIDSNPGPEIKTKREASAERLMGPRRRYRDLFGRWPRNRDMTRAIESGLLKVGMDEDLPDAEVVPEQSE